MPEPDDALVVARQGSFAVGGRVITAPGDLDVKAFMSPEGNTLHADHAYVQYQVPVNPRRLPIVLWHGGGQFSKTWETTPDGREGYQNILLRRRWSVYLLDQPGRGRAGQSSETTTIAPLGLDRSLWQIFRLGIWPDFFPGVQFDQNPETVDQYWRQVTPNTSSESPEIVCDAVAALFDKIGPGILLTHSMGGQYGFRTRLQCDNVRANVAYEPATFLFPDDDVPAEVPSDYPFVAAITAPVLVPPASFEELTKIPIQLVYGDNIPSDPDPHGGLDLWRVATARAEQFAEAVNRRGGDVSILRLNDAGLSGNTHFPFSDLNNLEVADLLARYLADKGLDGTA